MNSEEMRAMVVEQLDLKDLTPDMQDQIIDKFTENTMKKITVALFERLPEGAKAEFVKLGDAGDSAAVLKLLQDNVPDMDAFVAEEVKAEVAAFKEFQSGS